MRAVNLSFIFVLIAAFISIVLIAFIALFLYTHFSAMQGVGGMTTQIANNLIMQEYQRCIEQFQNETLCSYILQNLQKPVSYSLLADIRFWVILTIVAFVVAAVAFVTKRQ